MRTHTACCRLKAPTTYRTLSIGRGTFACHHEHERFSHQQPSFPGIGIVSDRPQCWIQGCISRMSTGAVPALPATAAVRPRLSPHVESSSGNGFVLFSSLLSSPKRLNRIQPVPCGPCRHEDTQPYESVMHDPLAKISPHFYRSEPMKSCCCAGFQKDHGNVEVSRHDWESRKGVRSLCNRRGNACMLRFADAVGGERSKHGS
jgi:hypothetical protein